MSASADSPRAPKPDKRPWTVLVYMVADDPSATELLDQQANQELDQLVFATLSRRQAKQKLHVAAQVDFRSHHGVVRRVFGEGTWEKPESNAADPDTLYGFFAWAREKCPAERYLLMFWGHSQGPFGLFADKDPWVWAAQTLTLTELKEALGAAKKDLKSPVDIVVFKDCFMSSVETAYELKDLANFLIASQGIVPIDIWPYEKMFEGLTPETDSGDAARTVVRALGHHYKKRDDVPFSLLDTRKADGVTSALAGLVRALTVQPNGNGTEVRKALAGAMSGLGDTAMLEVRELCKAFMHPRFDPAVRASARNLEAAVANDLVVELHAKRKWSPGKSASFRRSAFGGVSLFCCPFKTQDRKKSRVLSRASEGAYLSLGLSETGWPVIALAAMPQNGSQAAMDPLPAALPGFARLLLPLVVIEQLQDAGYLEELRRQAATMAQRTIADLLAAQAFGPPPKAGGGFASPPKGGGGFASGPKPGGGFAGPKGGGGFAAPPKGGGGFGPPPARGS